MYDVERLTCTEPDCYSAGMVLEGSQEILCLRHIRVWDAREDIAEHIRKEFMELIGVET